MAGRDPRGRRSRLWLLPLVLGVAASLAAVAFVAWPLPGGSLSRDEMVSVQITDRNGGLLRELRSRQDGRSVSLPRGEVPPLVRAAFLAAEDRRFESHPGVDPLAVGRALGQNLRAGRVISGASTIPQQLARQLVPRKRTLVGKVGEALWALRLSAHLPKERILLEYLNRVPLGNSLHGVEAAAQFYFGRPASRLSVGQAALLAGMARSPARLDPFRHPDRAVARMRQVLDAMVEAGLVDGEAAQVAKVTSLDLVRRERAFAAPHLTAWLSGSLDELGLGRAATIRTTVDPGLQADVEELVRQEIAALEANRVGNAAVIVVDNHTGEVLAWVGSADFLDEARGGQNDGVRSLRQPGSTLKPFSYGLALADGATAATVLSDIEVHLATPSGDYVPRNYDRRVHGPVRLRAALANSYNVPAVRVSEQQGPARLLEVLRRAGFHSLTEDASHYGVGLVLGNGDVSLWELAAAYRGLALGGVARPIRAVRSATDADSQPIKPVGDGEPVRFLPADVVGLLTDILADEAARSPAFGLDNALRFPFPVAAKTGTSRAYVDNWAAGFTRERTVAVWVGNFDGTPMKGVSGISGAGPLLRRVMLRAMAGIEPAPLVDRSAFERRSICPLSGQLSGPACGGAIEEVFLPGTEPREICSMHRHVRVDERGRQVGCGEEGGRLRPVLDVGPGFYAWARGEGLDAHPVSGCEVGGEVPPTGDPSGRAEAARLLLPGDGDEYLLEPGIPLSDQTIPVRAVLPTGVHRAEVRTDDGQIRHLEAPFSIRIPARKGERWIELWLPGGDRPAASARYRVR